MIHILNKLVKAIIELNKVIANDDSLGSGFCIGHSYLCNLGKVTTIWRVSWNMTSSLCLGSIGSITTASLIRKHRN